MKKQHRKRTGGTQVQNEGSVFLNRLSTSSMPKSKSESDGVRCRPDGEVSPALKEEPVDEVKEPASPQLDEHQSSQNVVKATHIHFLQLPFHSIQLSQNRPSVLRSTSLLPLGHASVSQPSPDEHEPAPRGREKDTGCSSSQALARTNQHKTSCAQPASPVHSDVVSPLYLNGRCRWPSCDEACEEYDVFLEHLKHGHSCGEITIAQCRIQQERVQHMENQLIKERQKLHAMRLHLRVSEHPPAQLRAGLGWHSVLALGVPPIEKPDGGPGWANKVAGRQEYWRPPAPHLPSDFVSSMECYKYVNIRPPYTYAFLIRWSILEAPNKQRALNDIYNWFIQMFFYFRHNTPTWKVVGHA